MKIKPEIKPFDHVAGCSCGTKTELYQLREILAYGCAMGELSADDVRQAYDEALDDTEGQCSIDLDYWTNWLQEAIGEKLPLSCGISWDDGELRVLPYIDDDMPKAAELPDACNDDGVILIVNDHGNTSLYQWRDDDWREVWALV